jgi:hypothetical protein
MSAESAARDKFGISLKPIVATRVWGMPLPYFQKKGIDAWSWVLVNDSTKMVVHVNTYSSKAGRKFDAKEEPLNEEQLAKKVKGYESLGVEKCPIAIAL